MKYQTKFNAFSNLERRNVAASKKHCWIINILINCHPIAPPPTNLHGTHMHAGVTNYYTYQVICLF